MCEHKNRKMIDWLYNGNQFASMHESTYLCQDCGDTFTALDTPIIYDYRSKSVEVSGVGMRKEDYELIKHKESVIADKE